VSVALSEARGPGGGFPWAGAVVVAFLVCGVIVWMLRRHRKVTEEFINPELHVR